MRELTIQEHNEVTGGVAWFVPVIAVIVITQAVIPAAEGFVEGFSEEMSKESDG